MPFRGQYPLDPNVSLDRDQGSNFYAATAIVDVPPLSTVNVQFKTSSLFVKFMGQDLNFLNGEIDYKLIEGATCTDGVTVIPSENADRRVGPSSVLITTDPTGVTGGVVINPFPHFSIESDISNAGPIEESTIQTVTLKENTNYIFAFTNPSATDTVERLSLTVSWAE